MFDEGIATIFSPGLSSGARDGSSTMVIFSGMSSCPVVRHPARSINITAWDFGATVLLISSRCACMASVLANGMINAAPCRSKAYPVLIR
jgi:hypothetical protein